VARKLALCFALERLPTEIEPLENALCDQGREFVNRKG